MSIFNYSFSGMLSTSTHGENRAPSPTLKVGELDKDKLKESLNDAPVLETPKKRKSSSKKKPKSSSKKMREASPSTVKTIKSISRALVTLQLEHEQVLTDYNKQRDDLQGVRADLDTVLEKKGGMEKTMEKLNLEYETMRKDNELLLVQKSKLLTQVAELETFKNQYDEVSKEKHTLLQKVTKLELIGNENKELSAEENALVERVADLELALKQKSQESEEHLYSMMAAQEQLEQSMDAKIKQKKPWWQCY